jgi:hypothetical protein
VPTLKRYLDMQCANAEFRGLYNESCEVCRVTVDLVARMHALGLKAEEVAGRAGVTVRELTDLVEADHCSYEMAAKLCQCLGALPPDTCRRKPKS